MRTLSLEEFVILMRRHIRYCFEPIGYEWNNLTDDEKRVFGNREAFNLYINWSRR